VHQHGLVGERRAVPARLGEFQVTETRLDVVSTPSGRILIYSATLVNRTIDELSREDFTSKTRPALLDLVATNPALQGSLNVDDECNITEKTFLVRNGILKTYLHDRISATHYGVKPTGSGRRESFRFPVQPRMRNTYMLPGPHKKEEIIASVKKGIYAESFTNGQVFIGGGDFSFYVKSGYLIEDGKLGKPLKDVNIIGNGPQVLKDIVMVGNDLVMGNMGGTCGKSGQRVPVSMGLPTVKVSSITVGGIKS